MDNVYQSNFFYKGEFHMFHTKKKSEEAFYCPENPLPYVTDKGNG